MKGGPKSSLRPFLHRALQLYRSIQFSVASLNGDQCPVQSLISAYLILTP